MTTNDRLSDEQIDFAIRMEPPHSGIARALREVQSSRATLAAIEAHVTAWMADDSITASSVLLAIRDVLHPNPEEDPT